MSLVTPVNRGGIWYVIRRVPARFAAFDPRVIVRVSTHIRVADDPKAIRAAAIATQLNRDLEQEWRAKAAGLTVPKEKRRYDDALLDARGMGFDYATTAELMTRPIEELVSRIEVLIGRRYEDSPEAVSALLGGEDKPAFLLSELLTEYEGINRATLAQMSKDQVRKWRNARQRAVTNAVTVIGDKPVGKVTRDDAMKYRSWLEDRIVDEEIEISTANKEINSVSAMWTKVSEKKGLSLPPHFQRLAIEGAITRSRPPFSAEWIQSRLLAPGAFDGLDAQARHVLLVMVETGLRPSEICNLTRKTIYLNAPVPHVAIMPEGRILKAEASLRKMPLVGVSLAAMRLQPEGFPDFRDKSSGRLSIDINNYLTEAGLRETPEHTLYSLRHTFEDRLTALQDVPDKVQAYLMGHKYSRPKYGSDPTLPHLKSVLERIAFPAWPADL